MEFGVFFTFFALFEKEISTELDYSLDWSEFADCKSIHWINMFHPYLFVVVVVPFVIEMRLFMAMFRIIFILKIQSKTDSCHIICNQSQYMHSKHRENNKKKKLTIQSQKCSQIKWHWFSFLSQQT